MSQAEKEPAAARLRILIVDDDPFMLELLPVMLAEHGDFEIRAEGDARRALLSLSPPPHLLICDLSMPDMDGIEFMQAASLAGFAGNVLLLSAMDSGVRMAAEHLAEAQGLKVLGTYKKPISRSQLAEAISALREGFLDEPGKSHNLTPHSGK